MNKDGLNAKIGGSANVLDVQVTSKHSNDNVNVTTTGEFDKNKGLKFGFKIGLGLSFGVDFDIKW